MKPSEEYTIHILEDEDFEMLPVGNPKEAMGMTDPKRKVAWVRRTHVKDLDMHTINHEFDELMAGTSLHEIDGIRYKGLAALIKPIITAITALFKPTVAGTTAFGGKILGPSLATKGLVAAGTAAAGTAAARALSPKPSGGGGGAPQQAQRAPVITSAFAPQPSAQPLSEAEFQKGLSGIDTNLQSRLSSLSQLFRGQSEPENTAFSRQATSARTSAQSERDKFIQQQNEAKKVAGVF
jgi:hypothetical protein